MRYGNRFNGRYRSPERRFSTEAHFLKFAEARDEDDLTNPVFTSSDFPATTTIIDNSLTANPERLTGRAKAATVWNK